MPMYRFEIVDGVRLSDAVGLQCKDSHDAEEKAKFIATHIASDAPPPRASLDYGSGRGRQ